MAMLRRSLILSLLLVTALSLHAQTPCTWDEQFGQIVQQCGNVGIGSLTPLGSLHVRGFGQTTPDPQVTTTTSPIYGAPCSSRTRAAFPATAAWSFSAPAKGTSPASRA